MEGPDARAPEGLAVSRRHRATSTLRPIDAAAHQRAAQPPSTTTMLPVVKLLAGLAR